MFMNLELDTKNKVITLYEKVSIIELINTLSDLGIDPHIWSIVPKVREVKEVDDKFPDKYIPFVGTPNQQLVWPIELQPGTAKPAWIPDVIYTALGNISACGEGCSVNCTTNQMPNGTTVTFTI